MQPRVPYGLVATRQRKSAALGADLGASALDPWDRGWMVEKDSVNLCEFAIKIDLDWLVVWLPFFEFSH